MLRLLPILASLVLLPGLAGAQFITVTQARAFNGSTTEDVRFVTTKEYAIGKRACEKYLGLASASACSASASTPTADAGSTDAGVLADTVAATDAGSDVAALDATGADAKGGAPGKEDAASAWKLRITVNVTGLTNPELYKLGVAAGPNCPTTMPDKSTDDCTLAYEATLLGLTLNGREYEIPMKYLLGSACDTSKSSYVRFYFKWTGVAAANADKEDKVLFELDYDAPELPVIDSLQPGEGNLKVAYTDPNDSTEKVKTFGVYRGTAPFTFATLESSGASGSTGVTANPYQLTGLANGTVYYVGVTAIDQAGNESELCDPNELVTGTPIAVDNFWEAYKGAGGQEKGGFTWCFVATAAFGSPMAGEVQRLRTLRDRVLRADAGGRALVSLYYRVGPEAARIVTDHPWLRPLARTLLWPVVLSAVLLLGAPLLLGTSLAGLTLALRAVARRRARRTA